VYPAEPVGLADIHLLATLRFMSTILPRLARPGTKMPRALLFLAISAGFT